MENWINLPLFSNGCATLATTQSALLHQAVVRIVGKTLSDTLIGRWSEVRMSVRGRVTLRLLIAGLYSLYLNLYR